MASEIKTMVDKINKHMGVEMTAEPVRGIQDRYGVYVNGSQAYSGGYAGTLNFLDGYWANSRPMTVKVTDALKAHVERMLGAYRFVVVDYQGVRGTGDRYTRHEGTLFNQSTFDYYQANGWPSEL